MGRKKLPMNLISKKRARLVCFETRKKGLKKAAHELSTLCGVDIGMIIYDRDSNESEICGTTSLARMTQLYELCSAQDRRCRAYSVADYIEEEREKAKKMRDKAGRDECGRLSLHQLRELGEFLDAKIAAVRGKISSIKIKPEADDRVFLNQESGLFLNPFLNQECGILLNASQQESGVCLNPFLNQETGLFLNPSLQQCGNLMNASHQESGVCWNPFMNQESGLFLNPSLQTLQKSGVCWNASSLQESGLFLNPFLNQESGINCFHQDQQQTMLWGNPSLMQENLFLAGDIYGDMPYLVEASRNTMISETNSQLDIQDYEVSEPMFYENSS